MHDMLLPFTHPTHTSQVVTPTLTIDKRYSEFTYQRSVKIRLTTLVVTRRDITNITSQYETTIQQNTKVMPQSGQN